MNAALELHREMNENDATGLILLPDGAYVREAEPGAFKELLVQLLRDNPQLVEPFVEAIAEVRAIQ